MWYLEELVRVNNQGYADFLYFFKVNKYLYYAHAKSSHLQNIFSLQEFISMEVSSDSANIEIILENIVF